MLLLAFEETGDGVLANQETRTEALQPRVEPLLQSTLKQGIDNCQARWVRLRSLNLSAQATKPSLDQSSVRGSLVLARPQQRGLC